MSDFPDPRLENFNIITPWSMMSMGYGAMLRTTTPVASGVYVQNQAYFYPFELDKPADAVKMFLMNGATLGGNIDLGIYDAEWNAIVTLGATAQAGTSAIQEGNITDTPLLPGLYWMAFSGSSATATTFRAAQTDEIYYGNTPYLMQASAHPLPTGTASPVKNTEGSPLVHVMGVSLDTLI